MTPSQRHAVYINSSIFRMKALAVLERDGHACTKCGSRDDLQVNHKPHSYGKIPDEGLDDLFTLCRKCHEEYHCISPVSTGQLLFRL